MKSAKPTALLIALLSTSIVGLPAFAQSLDQGFRQPPQSAQPRVWWHWMNGNITEEGIKLDLEWMKRVGIGGIQNFDVALVTPQVVEKRLAYMTPEWKQAFRFAAKTADQMGMEMAIAVSPGWSETGGPWVKPEDGMKKMVWSETTISGQRGDQQYTGKLTAPPAVTGPFQDIPEAPDILTVADKKSAAPHLYRDTYVLAYRLTDGNNQFDQLPQPKVTASSGTINAALLFDGLRTTQVSVPTAASGPVWLRFDYETPQVIRSVTLAAPPVAMFRASPFEPVLQASADGQTFHEVGRIPTGHTAQYTISFAPVTAKAMRIVFEKVLTERVSPGKPAPGANSPFSFSGPPPKVINVSEVTFSGSARIHRFEEKAGFDTNNDYYAIATSSAVGPATVRTAEVLDLTGKMQPDGTLNWTPPAGTWRVLRLGYSLTGKENHPAPKEATGLEVDKYDADAVRRYINTYLDTYVDAAGPGLFGKRGVSAVLNDSIEVGASNWTGKLVAEFKTRRGYDPVPWLPALTGVLIESAARSDAFLYDFRKTLGELISENHYHTLTQELHKRGLTHYSEALESGRPILGDDMDMRRSADIPMAAMWSFGPEDIGPKASYWGDIRGAASVAHVYGQNLVAAESLTARQAPWAYSPRDLQPMIDAEFALGVNRPVIHTSVHQPLSDKAPGFSLFIFGQYFNRLETWAEQAKPWVSYLSRNAYMLQQGRFYADVAYFYGEEAPLTAMYDEQVPTDTPSRNAFDYVNPDVVLNQLSNDGPALVAKSGARYRVLYLGGSSQRMSLKLLQRLHTLVQGGATLVGERLTGSPGLMDDPDEFARIANDLWGSNTDKQVGKGRVLASKNIDAALATLNIAPDFGHTKPASDTTLMFVHRKTKDADLYYFSNRKERAETVELSFGITGKRPELWDAVTGTSSRVSYRTEAGQTIVPMTLQPFQSGYIVFRQPTKATAATISAPQSTKLLSLDGDWQLSFQSGRGAPVGNLSTSLSDWTRSDNPGVRYFSGTASYTRTLNVEPDWIKPDGKSNAKLMLDLGEVRELAEVLVNGKSIAIVWKPPYRVDLSAALKPGKNSLEVRVTNLWVNRLIGDAQPEVTKIGFTTYPMYKPDAPLRSSGLLGPVRLESVRN